MKFPSPSSLLLAVADRRGSVEIVDRVQPLKERFGDRVQNCGVADLASVPGFRQGRIQNALQKKQAQPMMLDWAGALPKRLAFGKDEGSTLVIDRQGAGVFQTSGAATPANLKGTITAIELLRTLAPASVANTNCVATE